MWHNKIGMIIPCVLSDEEIWFRLDVWLAQDDTNSKWVVEVGFIFGIFYFIAYAALGGRKIQLFLN